MELPLWLHITLGVLLAFVPSFGWLAFWYLKDYHEPEPMRHVALAFAFGALAVLPLLAVRWQLDEFSPNLQETLSLFRGYYPVLALVCGAILLAFLEEFLKHFATLRLGSRLKLEFTQIVDGIVYSVAAALGFAFAENLYYFWTLLSYYTLAVPELWTVIAFRAFGTTLGHALFSGVFGLLWGHAFLSRSVTPRHSQSVSSFFRSVWFSLHLHIFRHHILGDRPSRHGHEKADLVREGLLLATLFHACFNLLVSLEVLGYTLTPFVVPLLMLGLVFLGRQFLLRRNIQIMHPVAAGRESG